MLTGPDKTARLNVEIDAIEKLLSTKEEVLKNLSEMKASGGEWWMQIKAGLQERLSVLDNSVKLLESKRS